jgi:acyl-CoA synthetase (AMP-forming)/AMP-acid ligase II
MPLHHGYGLSEYAGALCLVRQNEWRDDTSAGYLIEGAELRIVDAGGVDVTHSARPTSDDPQPSPHPIPLRGEIWMRGPGLMPGYFRDTDATAQVMRPGGWYASGDVGYVDADGALFVVARLKEMIIRSGFNVYPGEVEAVLMQFPGVQRAAVVGRKEADGNEAVLAFIETTGRAPVDRVGLNAHLADNLAPYKRPASVMQLDVLPMTLSGKIMKRSLLDSLGSFSLLDLPHLQRSP